MNFARPLLDWYDRHGRRHLPWRQTTDPYRVWIAEIMLQQTTVKTVIPYYDRFLSRWPRLIDLAAADLAEVLRLWAGLGYYARARNLHRCARLLVDHYQGKFPNTLDELRHLPGIGEYTASSLAAIVFHRPVPVVDGNVKRIIARVYAIDNPRISSLLDVDRHRPGDFAQALMDLGALICSPHTPRCSECPIQNVCQAYAQGTPTLFPKKNLKKPKPTKFGVAFWIQNKHSQVVLRKRENHGLLGGMIDLPSTSWQEGGFPDASLSEVAAETLWRPLEGSVRHTFTHFHLRLMIVVGTYDGPLAENAFWCGLDDFDKYPLPTLTRKAIKHVALDLQSLDFRL